jgi:hypothetical protein
VVHIGYKVVHIGYNVMDHIGYNVVHIGYNVVHIGYNVVHIGATILVSFGVDGETTPCFITASMTQDVLRRKKAAAAAAAAAEVAPFKGIEESSIEEEKGRSREYPSCRPMAHAVKLESISLGAPLGLFASVSRASENLNYNYTIPLRVATSPLRRRDGDLFESMLSTAT